MGIAIPRESLLADPHVTWKHVGGPFLTWAGNTHWLTLRERLALWFKRTTIEAIGRNGGHLVVIGTRKLYFFLQRNTLWVLV